LAERTAIYAEFGDKNLKMSELRKAVAAEAYGTFLLTLLGPGSIIMMNYLSPFGPSNASFGFIGLAHGLAILAAVYSIGHISGAHINPAVTIAQWATHRFDKKKVVPYILAQVFGATLAALVHLAVWSTTASTYRSARETFLGTTVPNPIFGPFVALMVEVVATAVLVFTIFGATDKRAVQSAAGVAIGLVVAALIWVFGPISGASLNPARTFGPSLVSAVFSLSPLADLWIYVIGPVLGGLLGGFLYETLK
jgi:glycerol uptake facilitator protein